LSSHAKKAAQFFVAQTFPQSATGAAPSLVAAARAAVEGWGAVVTLGIGDGSRVSRTSATAGSSPPPPDTAFRTKSDPRFHAC
jgi:hypothetical protein